jgi:hypothetical protein
MQVSNKTPCERKKNLMAGVWGFGLCMSGYSSSSFTEHISTWMPSALSSKLNQFYKKKKKPRERGGIISG